MPLTFQHFLIDGYRTQNDTILGSQTDFKKMSEPFLNTLVSCLGDFLGARSIWVEKWSQGSPKGSPEEAMVSPRSPKWTHLVDQNGHKL